MRGINPAFAIAAILLSSGCGGGASSASDPTEPPAVDAAVADPDAAAGACITWTCLYADYFGPTGVSGCAGNGTCHGSPDQLGYMTSMYLCPAGDKDACYMGITSSAAALITPGAAFDGTALYANLRKTTGGGTMPKAPPYAFTPADLARIAGWVAAGAKND